MGSKSKEKKNFIKLKNLKLMLNFLLLARSKYSNTNNNSSYSSNNYSSSSNNNASSSSSSNGDASKRFANAKSISSDQFFGNSASSEVKQSIAYNSTLMYSEFIKLF
jgi:hypothetical protein